MKKLLLVDLENKHKVDLSPLDATLYWFARMLDGGCDPLYIARRAVRMASEDIGNADPRALTCVFPPGTCRSALAARKAIWSSLRC